MKIGVVGSRGFTDYSLLKTTLDKEDTIELIVSGGASGADALGERYARERGVETLNFKADWLLYGKAAGPMRNKDIVEHSDTIYAFWDGESKGTLSSINLAKKAGKPCIIVKYGKGLPILPSWAKPLVK